MKVKYLTVLDQEVGEVFQYELPENIETCEEYGYLKNGGPCYEDFLINKGHNLNNIEWMVHDEPTVKRMYYTN